MTRITEQEFAHIVDGIIEDSESIFKHNPIGTQEETLLWMLLSCLSAYLSLTEMESPCLTGKPDAETYRNAIQFVMKDRMEDNFDLEGYLSKFA